MRVAIGGDHAGFRLKTVIIQAVKDLGHDVTDHGSYDETPVDFPDVTRRVCADVLDGNADRAVLVAGTGAGVVIAANKIRGIRASICHDGHTAHQCVEHDDANVMCIGAKIVGSWLAVDLVSTYLQARFSGDEDAARRVEKIRQMERNGFGNTGA
ncbi:MAG TPA: RpiB/LacA/LacB family sugar-phosphate isomerase [bacterium]|nr:RpiB/LacA/LacB family sugar-phosphate isomerase [bacterium]